MSFIDDIFLGRVPDEKKTAAYGFAPTKNGRAVTKQILDGQFRLRVTLTEGGVATLLTDTATDEPYTLYLVGDANGAFVGSVRAAVAEALEEIAAQCFECRDNGETARELIRRVREEYGDELEYLWQDENAVWRRKDNQKWYGAVLTVSRRKFGFDSDAKVQVLDFRMKPEDLDAAADGARIFRGYHMNKKHWATVLLDGSMPVDEIWAYLTESYRLAKK